MPTINSLDSVAHVACINQRWNFSCRTGSNTEMGRRFWDQRDILHTQEEQKKEENQMGISI
jgi:hypothetical protein